MSATPRDRWLTAGSVLLGVSLIGVAAICLYLHDFAGQRQPVSASWPLRPALIAINIALLTAAGGALLVPRWRRYGAIAVATWLGLWVVTLHIPRMIAGVEAAWLGAAECLAIAAAAARVAGLRPARAVDAAYALCLFAFGAAHFVYVGITASMVPAWLPAHLFWAYFTGAGHVAAGLSLLSGLWTRLATRLLAVMFGSFVLLVNLPIAIKGALSQSTLELCFAVALAASAMLMAAGRPDRSVPN